MQTLIELLPLLAVAAYYLLRGRQRANAKRAPEQMQEAEGERAPTPFQSFMLQMEEALAEAAGEPEGPRGPGTPPVSEREPIAVEVDRAAPPSPLPVPPLRPAAPTPEFSAVRGSFSGASPVDHEAHGFGTSSPFSEERFERGGAPASGAARRRHDPHGLRPSPPEAQSARRAGRPDWRARLRDPQAARDAFVLQTLFGPRGGRHPAPERRGRG
ncbi:hypothetical protein RQM47_09485 [Rubrivirga sp. S365]|uniref:Uncharacterized protein n=1 Tax=Rubrivirga litoralis TaxID=3075598 RepID=A0ABU3BMJ7_9BACT|nr:MULTISPECIES: hypothetical protein [unclassified Rubrivirga]MDT0630513.1 hypothetical protein [Rubrivirga sp. F394]MDT7856872.1 hypothetical protein [Rubrivirga sp. S365]